MKNFLKLLAVFLPGLFIAVTAFFFWAKSTTLQKGDYHILYRNETIHQPQNDSLISVVSYNIGYLSGLTNNTPQRPTRAFYAQNEKRVISAIRAINPDIIGFQEIDYDSKRSYHTNQATMISDSLFPYGAFAVNWDKRYVPFPAWPLNVQFGKIVSGQAIMSKYPLTDPEIVQLEKVKSNPFYYNALYLDRLAQIVTVEHPVRTFKVINVHAEAFDAGTRQRQLKYLYDLFWDLEREFPVVLLGDFNSDPSDPDESIGIFMNDDRLQIAAMSNGSTESPKTYPSVNAKERLDYVIVHSDDFEIVDSRIVNEFGDISDHLPCWAKLKIK
jgi:Metal-dependent hydrolase